METLTESKILAKYVRRDGGDSQAVETAIGLFKAYNGNLQDFILQIDGAQQINTGGGCLVSCVEMDNGEVLGVNEECAVIYDCFESFEVKEEWAIDTTTRDKEQVAKDFINQHAQGLINNNTPLIDIYNNLAGGVYGEVRTEDYHGAYWCVLEIPARESKTNKPELFEWENLEN